VFQQEYLDYLYTVVEKMPYRYRNEVVADVLIYVSERDIDLSQKGDPRRYLRNLAYRLLNTLKKGDRCLPLLIDVPDKEIRPEIFKLKMGDLSDAIKKMPVHLQETLALLLDGKSVSEVAEALSSPNTKIWQRIRRIRTHLKNWAKNNFPDMGELL